jgi:hypothetical protein
VWTHLNYLVKKALQAGSAGKMVDLFNLRVHESFLQPMRVSWDRWAGLIESTPSLKQHFLRLMLTVSERGSERSQTKDRYEGRLRLGPRTVKPCLLFATLFALTIEAASRQLLSPDERGWANLSVINNDAGHLVGLELVQKVRIMSSMDRVLWGAKIVLLPHVEQSMREIHEEAMNLTSPRVPSVSLHRRAAHTHTFFTLDREFTRALEQGPTQLRQYLVMALSHDAALCREWVDAIDAGGSHGDKSSAA